MKQDKDRHDNRDKKGLLVVSFGTTHEKTCEETIGAIERHLAKAIPDRKLYRGWTSRMIIRRLKEKQGVSVDTVEEALARMSADGIRDVLVVPTHMIPGREYDKMMSALRTCAESAGDPERAAQPEGFGEIRVSRPLLGEDHDLTRLADIIAEELLPKEREKAEKGSCTAAEHDPLKNEEKPGETGLPGEGNEAEVLILMGHGSAGNDSVSSIYTALQNEFRQQGRRNVFIGTVEGRPDLKDVIDSLGRGHGIETGSSKEILLAPLMIVAGDHAVNDMAGDSEDSWKKRLEAEGWEVTPILRGLGASPGVQRMFCEHAMEAEKLVLNKTTK